MINKCLIQLFYLCIIYMTTTFLNGRTVESVVHQTYNQGFNPLAPGSADHCYLQSRCRPLHNSQCLDVTLPYKFTTITVWENQSFNEIHDYLNRWKGLRSIPQCWKALQSVLCATFFPRCDNESSRVSLPTHDMCRLTRHPCRLIEQHHHWPEFLRCDNQTLFPNKCKNEYTDLKFNTSGVGAKCSSPLVQTEDQNIWYPGIEGCALQCPNPIYTIEEHRKIRWFISHGSGISLLATLFSVLTFIIDWRSSNRYPAVIIFYLNMCFMISYMGWLLGSALTKGPHEIVCRPDNTTRYAEPGNSSENFYCLTVFLMIYYFLMAALVWFVNLAYAWDLSFQTSGAAHRDVVNSKVAYFHLTAWSVPLMLTISILALGEVDGDSLRGICFVGVIKPVMRICFVLIPITVSLIIGCYYMFRAMFTLIRVKLMNKTQNNSNRNKSKKIEHMIIRIGLFVSFAIIGVIITYTSHIYEFLNTTHWKNSLNQYIICTLNMTAALYPESTDTSLSESSGVNFCKLADRPNLMYAYLQLLAVFGAGICTSSWVWTSNSMSGWKRFIVRHLKPDINEPIRMKRHEMISKVFGRRHQLSQGCYSPSFHSMHSDPVGMNLNSAVSQDLSATWAAALPNFMYRRGAIVANDANNIQTNHYLPTYISTRHSSNSDVSQQRSYDSFRRSIDSQYSLEQLEMAVIDRHQRRKTKKEREKLLKAHNRLKPYRISRRRGSDTSGSIISAALAVRNLERGLKSECKSTSTGDLTQMVNNPMPQMVVNPFIKSPIASPSTIAMPFMPTLFARPRLSRPKVQNYDFTHCMNDQSSHLTNPLLERRRPDSCVPNAQFDNMNLGTGHVIQSINTTPNGTLITNNANNNSNIQLSTNFGMAFPLNNMSTTSMNSAINYMPSAQPLNYYQHSMNSFYSNMLANSQVNTFGTNFLAPAYPTTPLPNMPFPSQYPPYPQFQSMAQPMVPPQQQCNNLQDIQTLMREREAFLQLIRPMDSASEVEDNFLPIQLSDSEGIYSPDIQSRNEGLITAQELVDAHIQQVEARLEANGVNDGHNQTVVGALGDGSVHNVIDIQTTKSKSESKRKKKKSSKRHHKTNGNNANNSNNNNNCNELEEQKPLINNHLNTNCNTITENKT